MKQINKDYLRPASPFELRLARWERRWTLFCWLVWTVFVVGMLALIIQAVWFCAK